MSISTLFTPNSYNLYCGSIITNQGTPQTLVSQETLAVPVEYNGVTVNRNCNFKKFSYGSSISYVLIDIPNFSVNQAGTDVYTLHLAGEDFEDYQPHEDDISNYPIIVINNNSQETGVIRTDPQNTDIIIGAGYAGGNFLAGIDGLARYVSFTYRSVV